MQLFVSIQNNFAGSLNIFGNYWLFSGVNHPLSKCLRVQCSNYEMYIIYILPKKNRQKRVIKINDVPTKKSSMIPILELCVIRVLLHFVIIIKYYSGCMAHARIRMEKLWTTWTLCIQYCVTYKHIKGVNNNKINRYSKKQPSSSPAAVTTASRMQSFIYTYMQADTCNNVLIY